MKFSNSISMRNKVEKEEQITNQNIKKNIPPYMNLYPPVAENFDFDTNPKILKLSPENNLKNKNISSDSLLLIGEEDTYEINNDFLDSLLQRKTILDKKKIINTICKFIRNSKLIQKLEKEFRSDKKSELEQLIQTCAKSLNYIKLQKGEVLFKIGDTGDRFYFILNGKINILKLKELKNISLTLVEYLQYCIFLIEEKEEYILNEVTRKNRKVLDITYPEDIIKLYRIVFMGILRENILNHFIKNNQQLKEFFNNYKQKMEDFHLVESELKNLEEQKLKDIYGSKNEWEKWESYILKKCRPGIKDIIFFEDYEQKFKDKSKKDIICYVYESFLFLGPGLFFGDFALDSEQNRRNATIRAEEETILGWLKSVDYANMIAPKRKIEKFNEVMFLYNNFFFKHINSHTFERKYFHLFPPQEFYKNLILFKSGTMPNSLYFIKEGQISLEFKLSIFEIHYLIKKIFEQLITNEYYKKIISKYKNKFYLIGEDVIRRIKKYFTEPIFFKLRDKSEKFREELEKKAKYKLSVLSENEIIGIEEIFLGMPYFCSGTIISKKLVCYQLTIKQLEKFIDYEKNILSPYTKSSVNKIITLIDRLQNIKKNGIYMARLKYDYINEKTKDKNMSINNIISLSREQMNKFDISSNNNNIRNISSFNRKISSYYDKKSNKENNKLLDTNKEKFKLSFLKINQRLNNSNNNKKKLSSKNFSFLINPYEDLNKNNNGNSNIIYRNNNQLSIPINEKNNSDMLLIGNTCIKINKVKNEINKYNILDNNNQINKTSSSKLFEFSRCKYPLSEEREKIIKDSYDYENNEIKKIFNNKSKCLSNRNNSLIENSNNKNYKSQEKKMFNKKVHLNNFLSQIKLKKGKSNLTVADIKRKINIIDISQISHDKSMNKLKIIHPKELLSNIVKDYYNNIKSKGFISFISKRETNTYFTRKTHNRYNKEKKLENNRKFNNECNKNNSLPKIRPNSLSHEKNILMTKTFVDK